MDIAQSKTDDLLGAALADDFDATDFMVAGFDAAGLVAGLELVMNICSFKSFAVHCCLRGLRGYGRSRDVVLMISPPSLLAGALDLCDYSANFLDCFQKGRREGPENRGF